MLINHSRYVPKSPPLSSVLEMANLALSFSAGSPGLWMDGFKNSGKGWCYLGSNLVGSEQEQGLREPSRCHQSKNLSFQWPGLSNKLKIKFCSHIHKEWISQKRKCCHYLH